MTAMTRVFSMTEWEQLNASLTRATIHGASMSVTRYRFALGGRFPNHVHDQEQITYVVHGQITFLVGADSYSLGVADVIVIPPSIPHAAIAGPAGAEVLSVVCPARIGGRDLRIVEGGPV